MAESKYLEIALRNIRNEILEEAAKVAEGIALLQTRRDRDEYWTGRCDAAERIREMKS